MTAFVFISSNDSINIILGSSITKLILIFASRWAGCGGAAGVSLDGSVTSVIAAESYKTILQFKASCPTMLKKSGCLITLASKVLILIKARDRFSQVNSKLTISKLATNFSLMLSITLATFEGRGAAASIICLVSSLNELRRAARLSSVTTLEPCCVSCWSFGLIPISPIFSCSSAAISIVVFVGDLGGGGGDGAAFFGGGCGILSPIFIASITRSSARFKLMAGSCGCEDTCNLPKLTTTADCLPGRKIPPIGTKNLTGALSFYPRQTSLILKNWQITLRQL
uniref:Uncharacterized protein n=1 Tax=Glossina austeni TaxID=7395 RepID=A0A1A9VL19_GLOAU